MKGRLLRWTVGWLGLGCVLSLPAHAGSAAPGACPSPDAVRWLVSAAQPWLPPEWPEWSAATWEVHLRGWSTRRAWAPLQAAAYVLTVCGADALARQAWTAGFRAYLRQGGVPVYAQAPDAFPWWRLWDAEYAHTGVTPALAERFLQASPWTPNLWDRSVRSGLLTETFRQRREVEWALRIRDVERALARDFAPYRVAPLEWEAHRRLLEWAFTAWVPIAAAGLALWVALGPRPSVRTLGWATVGWVGFAWGLSVPRAWYVSALSTWQTLRDSLLRDGFIDSPPPPWDTLFADTAPPRNLPRPLRDLPLRWRAYRLRSLELWERVGGNDPVLSYDRALLARDGDGLREARRAAPILIGPWQDFAPDRLIPPVPTWPELYTAVPSARWTSILEESLRWTARQIPRQTPAGGLAFGTVLAVGLAVRTLHERAGRLGSRVGWVLALGIPGSSRFRQGREFQGFLLFITAALSTALAFSMHRTPPSQVWSGLLTPEWLARIETVGSGRLLLWGGLYLTLWGLALFAWTVHGMAFWWDVAAQERRTPPDR